MTERMRRVNLGPKTAPVPQSPPSSSDNELLLRSMVEDFVVQQSEYHARFKKMISMFERMVEERRQIRSIFMKDSDKQEESEAKLIGQFKSWVAQQESELKSDDDYRLNLHRRHFSMPKLSSLSPSSKLKEEEKKLEESSDHGIIDLSYVDSNSQEDMS